MMKNEQAEKKFPSYFANFEMPEWAREQELEVFRACATGKVDDWWLYENAEPWTEFKEVIVDECGNDITKSSSV